MNSGGRRLLTQLTRALRSDAVVTFALAAGYFQLVWGFEILNVYNLEWVLAVEHDLTLFLTTTAYFRFSEWAFPVTHFDSLLYPLVPSTA